MNVDRILDVFNRHSVDYLLVGGMNYLLRHEPILTYDVDIWVDDRPDNLTRCAGALVALDAAWGRTESDWKPVKNLPAGWLGTQTVFCLTSPHGSIDVFRNLVGLRSWADSKRSAVAGKTSSGTPYVGISDLDMLCCQLALDEKDRKQDRIRRLRAVTGGRSDG